MVDIRCTFFTVVNSSKSSKGFNLYKSSQRRYPSLLRFSGAVLKCQQKIQVETSAGAANPVDLTGLSTVQTASH